MSFVRSLRNWFRTGEARFHLSDTDARADEEGPALVDLTGADTIDLHTFQPREIASVIHEFLEAAVERGHRRVRIIHGKGIGVQRKIVASILEKHPAVLSHGVAPDASGWGATVVELRSKNPEETGEPNER